MADQETEPGKGSVHGLAKEQRPGKPRPRRLKMGLASVWQDAWADIVLGCHIVSYQGPWQPRVQLQCLYSSLLYSTVLCTKPASTTFNKTDPLLFTSCRLLIRAYSTASCHRGGSYWVAIRITLNTFPSKVAFWLPLHSLFHVRLGCIAQTLAKEPISQAWAWAWVARTMPNCST